MPLCDNLIYLNSKPLHIFLLKLELSRMHLQHYITAIIAFCIIILLKQHSSSIINSIFYVSQSDDRIVSRLLDLTNQHIEFGKILKIHRQYK